MMDLILAQAAPQSVVIGGSGWERKPTGEQLWNAYPREARGKRIAGRAMLICKVEAAGRLTDCTTDFVEPAGFGFGAAALKVAPIFRMQTRFNGRPTVGSTVHIPVIFAPSKPAFPIELAAICYAYAQRLAAEAQPSPGAERAARYWRYRFPGLLKEAGHKADPANAMAEASAQEALRPAELREVDPRRRCEGLVPGPES